MNATAEPAQRNSTGPVPATWLPHVLFILFAGPLILGVSSMMALEVFRPKFWSKVGKELTADSAY